MDPTPAYQIHYLDDFLFFGAPLAEEAAAALETVVRILRSLGIPIATHKTECPTTSLIFLGILVDTCTFELRLPVTRLQIKLDTWTTRKHCQKHELESLLGHLSHAATVVRHSRTFLRQLFTLLSRAHRSRHFIHLTAGAKAGGRRFSRSGMVCPSDAQQPPPSRSHLMPQAPLDAVPFHLIMGGFN